MTSSAATAAIDSNPIQCEVNVTPFQLNRERSRVLQENLESREGSGGGG